MNFAFSFPIAVLSQYFFGTIIFLLSLFMVLLILVQRGKGGGLTGALGGPGGQSAFGTKAGDLFTRITIVAAACWIFLLAFCTWWYTESDFAAALADEAGAGAGQVMPAAGDAGTAGPGSLATGAAVPSTEKATSDATVPVVPSGDAPADPASKPAGEVEAIDMPKSSEASAKDAVKDKDSGQPTTEPAQTTESSEKPESAKPAVKTETEAPKAEPSKKDAPSSDEPTSPSKPPELTPPEPAAGEPKADAGAPPASDK